MGLVDWCNAFKCLDLEDQFREDVYPVAHVCKLLAIVDDRDRNLELDGEAVLLEFVGEAGLVSTLRRPGPSCR